MSNESDNSKEYRAKRTISKVRAYTIAPGTWVEVKHFGGPNTIELVTKMAVGGEDNNIYFSTMYEEVGVDGKPIIHVGSISHLQVLRICGVMTTPQFGDNTKETTAMPRATKSAGDSKSVPKMSEDDYIKAYHSQKGFTRAKGKTVKIGMTVEVRWMDGPNSQGLVLGKDDRGKGIIDFRIFHEGKTRGISYISHDQIVKVTGIIEFTGQTTIMRACS